MNARVFLIAAAAAVALAAPAHAAVQPYGTNDAGGFRNVLPPGEAGTDNAFAARRSSRPTGARPPHCDDQQPLYDGLLYASPTLTHDDVAKLLQGRDVRRASPTTSSRPSRPRPGVTIVRDKQLRRAAHLRRHARRRRCSAPATRAPRTGCS